MSIGKCPECSGKVSSYAQQCIHCGYPLIKHEEICEQRRAAAKKVMRCVHEARKMLCDAVDDVDEQRAIDALHASAELVEKQEGFLGIDEKSTILKECEKIVSACGNIDDRHEEWDEDTGVAIAFAIDLMARVAGGSLEKRISLVEDSCPRECRHVYALGHVHGIDAKSAIRKRLEEEAEHSWGYGIAPYLWVMGMTRDLKEVVGDDWYGPFMVNLHECATNALEADSLAEDSDFVDLADQWRMLEPEGVVPHDSR